MNAMFDIMKTDEDDGLHGSTADANTNNVQEVTETEADV